MAGKLRGMAHLRYFELISIDVVETNLLLLLDCILQFTDSLRRRNANGKDSRIAEPENQAVEQDIGGGHVHGSQASAAGFRRT